MQIRRNYHNKRYSKANLAEVSKSYSDSLVHGRFSDILRDEVNDIGRRVYGDEWDDVA